MSFIDIAAIVGGAALEAGLDTALFEGASAGLGALVEGGVTGAALGAGTSALTGQDIGKGALWGGLGGAVTGGLGSMFGGESGAAASATPKAAGTMGSEIVEPELGSVSVGQSGMTMPTTEGEMYADQLESQVANANEAAQGLPGVQPPVQTPTTPTNTTSIFDKTNPYRTSINDQLKNTMYGKHKLMVPGVGAVGANLMFGGNSPTQATPPGGGGAGWNPLAYYKFNPQQFQGQPSGYTGYLYNTTTPTYLAEGGIASLTGGSPATSAKENVDFMGGDMYPGSQQKLSFYNEPSQLPMSAQQATASYEAKTNPLTGEPTVNMAEGGIAQLSVGGKLLKGNGDGMSDDIHANIDGHRQARLADGEFVIPADVVSHLGNGSTDAGAKQLYAMMDKVRKARTGRKSQGKKINAHKFVPA